jgi:hypothetical protein
VQRTFDQVGLVKTQRLEDALPQCLLQRHAGHVLHDQPEREVVAAVVLPPCPRREEARQFHDLGKLLAMPELEAVCRVAAVRLEKLHVVERSVRKTARVVEQLADGDALRDRTRIAVELEQPFLDELQDEGRHEELRDAPDAEPMLGRQGLARLHVRKTRRCFDDSLRPCRDDGDAGNAAGQNSLELVAQGSEPNPLGSLRHQERSRGPAPELARQPA